MTADVLKVLSLPNPGQRKFDSLVAVWEVNQERIGSLNQASEGCSGIPSARQRRHRSFNKPNED